MLADCVGDNRAYIEDMQVRYAHNPESIPDSWRRYFEKLAESENVDHQALVVGIANRAISSWLSEADMVRSATNQCAVNHFIGQFRLWGAREADINPLDYDKTPSKHLLPETYGLTEEDQKSVFSTDIVGLPKARLGDIITRLQEIYCGTITAELMHVSHDEQRLWLLQRFESPRPVPSKAEALRLLERLIAAETLEKYLHTRYVGQKRFSLEGSDALIPLLDTLLQRAGECGVVETVIGMAHRGRLNVLVNILGKQPAELFMEFEGKQQNRDGSGDVKYHMGFSSTLKTAGGNMHLALAFNPSHLEIVNPVVEGSVRARQDRRGDTARKQVLPIQIHGDAAFAGQGVVMETLNFSQVRGFKTGGTVHIIINNQIGFTTSTPDDARSTFFCSDIAKMVEIPIIHVCCDNVDDVAWAAKTALDFRQTFGTDIIIDLVCFRRHGHNEQDEPLMTQPLMYQKIARHPGSLALYTRRLKDRQQITEAEAEALRVDYRKKLETGESANADIVLTQKSNMVNWEDYRADKKDWDWYPSQPVPLNQLSALGKILSTLPDNFIAHAQLKKLVRSRAEMAAGERPIDWGMAENLAYATLLEEGHAVRLSGQDCGRGTFAHRHAVWHDQQRSKRDGGRYIPLRNLSAQQADFLVIDSILSEEGVLAFEYGYATTEPKVLVLWEGQFGDFANGAQVVIDQFIASGEVKWGRFCGLVMLLPHGYEGQGPEHSSARLERYLQMCAEYNIQVCVPSSPAQIYHLLRRQSIRKIRRPLVIISPKSLLRHPEVTSSLEELSTGRFEPVIGEVDNTIKPAAVQRLIFCSGKIYYEICAARRSRQQIDVAVCRLEQLYPFPHQYVKNQINKYASATQIVWCQEEPGNQGAWHRLQHYFRRHLNAGQHLTYALRPSSASPAAGYADLHKKQQQEVITAALDIHSVV